MTPSEEIKSKLDIVEVLREYIPLKAAGVNFTARCPFHNEKSPSFMVSPDKQIWHCFGCGKGGDIFKFVMEIEGLEFVEALRLLATKAGVVLKKQDPRVVSERQRLLEILDAAASFYQNLLARSAAAEPARQYLLDRGLTNEVILDWQLGASSDSWDDLLIHLKGKGFREAEILSAGLIIAKSNSNRFFNRFRQRVMFPLFDINSNIVGFTARLLPGADNAANQGKYVNSPQTPVYDKSHLLYGLDKAKLAIKQAGYVIVMEGQMDVIAAHQFGYKNVVASSGTAFTEAQLTMLKRYTNNLVLAFDMDQAGSLAIDRSVLAALALDFNIKVLRLPAGKDPDECIRRDRKLWDQALADKQELIDYYFASLAASLDLSRLDQRRKMVEAALPIVARLPNPVSRDFWLQRLSQAVATNERELRERLAPLLAANRTAGQPTAAAAPLATGKISREELLSEAVLALILRQPAALANILDWLAPAEVVGSLNQGLYKSLIVYYNKFSSAGEPSYADFREWLVENQPQLAALQLPALDRLVLLGEKDYYALEPAQVKAEILKISQILHRSGLQERLRDLAKLISQLEEQVKRADSREDKKQLDDLVKEFSHLSQELAQA